MATHSAAAPHTHAGARAHVLAIGACAVLLAYFWLLPFVKPRGPFIWGHFRLVDLYGGVPVLLGLLWLLAGLRGGGRRRRMAAAVAATSFCLSVAVCDVLYLFGPGDILRPWDFWRGRGRVPWGATQSDPDLGWVRLPHHTWTGPNPHGRTVSFSADRNGFRNPDSLRRAEVVFIGDSFTEAAQVEVEETFVRQVQSLTGLACANLGRSGYGPQQDLVVLERYGFDYAPRTVVWQIFEGNDLDDAAVYVSWRSSEDAMRVLGSRRFVERYVNISPVVQVLNRTVRDPSAEEEAALEAAREGVRLRLPGDVPRHVRLLVPFYKDATARYPLGLHETKRVIERGFRLCRERGIRLIVLYTPRLQRVLGPWLEFDKPEYRDHWLPPAQAGVPPLSSVLAEHCRQLGCELIDTTSALQAAAGAGSPRLYFLNRDEHFDVDGHRVVAALIAERLSPAKHFSPARARRGADPARRGRFPIGPSSSAHETIPAEHRP